MSERKPIQEITLIRAEGPTHLCGIKHIFSGYESANNTLIEWAANVEGCGGYKIDFTASFGSDDNYTGTYILYGLDSKHGFVSLRAHMRYHLEHIIKEAAFASEQLKTKAQKCLEIWDI